MEPVCQGDHGGFWKGSMSVRWSSKQYLKEYTVIDVVEVGIGVLRVEDNEGTPETITVLCGQVTVVPEGAYIGANMRDCAVWTLCSARTGLVRDLEIVQE